MSQCHDPYNPIQEVSTWPAEAVGDQCHDVYPVSIEWESVRPGHICAVVGDSDGAVRQLRVTGRLDWATEDGFLAVCNKCANSALIVDLSAATLDSAGTAALMSATARAAKWGQRVVFVLTDPVELEVLNSLGLGSAVPVVGSVPEALRWFEDHAVSVRAV
jgi:anti-anti-sigma regulatory factor